MRARMEHVWESATEQAEELRDPMRAPERLNGFYYALDAEERLLADRVLAEWMLSDDDRKRYDADLLIDEYKVKSAEPALRTLMAKLATSTDPLAPYEQKKVARLLEKLGLEPPTAA